MLEDAWRLAEMEREAAASVWKLVVVVRGNNGTEALLGVTMGLQRLMRSSEEP